MLSIFISLSRVTFVNEINLRIALFVVPNAGLNTNGRTHLVGTIAIVEKWKIRLWIRGLCLIRVAACVRGMLNLLVATDVCSSAIRVSYVLYFLLFVGSYFFLH